ncbi:MAG TPA: hypothetical protein VJR92_12330 [Gemmatimonadaceae bacterium]|nr:hypothetical protein [Gemmatimonadaceae bacterium]
MSDRMGYTARASLKHEYQEFVEREIEEYKDRVSRSAILKIADEAAQRLHAQEQVTLNELVLWLEVDRIIAARLRLPAYQTWARQRRKHLQQLRRPETWGLRPDAPIVRNLPANSHAHVLVAQPEQEGAALFLAANGCTVTAVEPEADVVQRVMLAAEQHGLTGRVQLLNADLNAFAPSAPLAAVVCSPQAFAGLSSAERARVFAVLQSATADGGVHLVETIVAGKAALDLDELRASYAGWSVSVEADPGTRLRTFVARKA